MSAGLPPAGHAALSSPPPQPLTDGGWRQEVRSPDQVLLELPIAGPSSRMAAYALDALLVAIVALLLFLLLMFTGALMSWGEQIVSGIEELETQASSGPDAQLFVLSTLLVVWMVLALFSEILYFVFWEFCTGGKSPGKWALGLRVVRDGGQPLHLGASLIRNLLRFADVLPSSYLVGLVSILATRDAKRLGDLAAGTIVVREDRPAAVVPFSVGEAPAVEADFPLRREHLARFGREEDALARGALRRIEALSGSEEEALVERAVAALCQRLQYRDEVPAGARRGFLRALLTAADREVTGA